MAVRILNIIFFFFVYLIPAFAQLEKDRIPHLSFKQSPFKEKDINAFEQDAQGFIWIGTDNGLYRYDGYFAKKYTHNFLDTLNLSHKQVRCLHIDKQQRLWIGTNNGLNLYDKDKDLFIPIPLVNTKNPETKWYAVLVHSIIETANGDLFIRSASSILKLNKQKMQLESFAPLRPLEEKYGINCIHPDHNGDLWIGTNDGGLFLYRMGQGVLKRFWSGAPDNYKIPSDLILGNIVQDADGEVWYICGVVICKINKNRTQTKSYTQRNLEVSEILLDSQKNIWIATHNGLYRYDRQSDVFVRNENKEENEYLSPEVRLEHLFEDRDNNLWIFGYDCGLSLANLKKGTGFESYPSKYFNGKIDFSIMNTTNQDAEGNVWVGTNDGLYQIDKKNQLVKQYGPKEPKSQDMQSVAALLFDHNNELWIGTFSKGLFHLNQKTGQLTHYMNDPKDSLSLNFNDVTALLEDNDKNILILTLQKGLNILDRKTNTFAHFTQESGGKKRICNNSGITMTKCVDGKIWIGTFFGLSQMDVGKKEFLNYYPGFGRHRNGNSLWGWALAVFEDSKRNIWVGTDMGVNFINPKTLKITFLKQLEELMSQRILKIFEDKHGNIWFISDHRFYKYMQNKQIVAVYDFSEHLPGMIKSVFVCKDRRVLIGGTKGYTFFDPERYDENNEVLQPSIIDFKIFDRTVKPGDSINGRILLEQVISRTKRIDLTQNEKNFSFEFAAIDFTEPEKLKYSFMMQGFDKEWRHTSYDKRIASYTNLEPGTYFFKLKVENNTSKSNEKIIVLEIHIHPYWWRTWWAYLLYLVIVGTVAFYFTRMSVLRMKLRKDLFYEKLLNEKEAELHQRKLAFFTNITHELRTPLTLIIGPVVRLIEKFQHDADVSRQLILIKKNADKQLNLINELLDLRKFESGKMDLKIDEENLSDLVRLISSYFSDHANIHNINLQTHHSNEQLSAWIDKDKMEKVFINLLSNAFKFTPDGGTISIEVHDSIKDGAAFANISVIDSGIGIHKDAIAHVFDPYYSSSRSMLQNSTGIGLFLSKEIVELHKGTLTASSIDGQGSVFVVEIPLGRAHFHEDLFVRKNENMETDIEESIIEPVERAQQKKGHALKDTTSNSQVLLIVEDNVELRLFLKQDLEERYQVLEADNGAVAFELAVEKQPDLIISDVMMPVMDGIELCGKLKSNEKTSHIPIILLTAKTSIESRIEGLESGADSYIPKPFHPQHLDVRIRKLIEQRTKMQEKNTNNFIKYTHTTAPQYKIEVKEKELVTSDELFLKKAVGIVERNLSNSDFNVEKFSELIGMNYFQLYRKLKALTNLTTSDFIQNIRLKVAANLLLKNKFSITEICYEVGFSSPSYFTKCFRDIYGLTPSQYIEKQQPS